MPTRSMHMLPSLLKDCSVAVTSGCVVKSLPSIVVREQSVQKQLHVLKKTRTQTKEPHVYAQQQAPAEALFFA
jgi:hypothetical protein